jgi:centromere/kinetochore protein ZW10
VNKSCRAIKLLDIRAFELKSDVHEVFDHVWNTLISVDRENQRVSISTAREGGCRQVGPAQRYVLTIVDEPMNLQEAVIGLKAYKEVDQRMERLWQDINQVILLPRLDITRDTLPKLHTEDVSLLSRPSENAL